MTKAAPTFRPDEKESIFVAKIGGANVSRLHLVRDYIRHSDHSEKEFYLVVSAFKGVTDKLVQAFNDCIKKNDFQEFSFDEVRTLHQAIINEYLPECNEAAWEHYEKELEKIKAAFSRFQDDSITYTYDQLRDYITGAGERMSAGIVEIYLEQEGVASKYIGDVQAVQADGYHEGMKEGLKEILSASREEFVKIISGHIQTDQGAPRGYSDYTGVLVAAVVAELKGFRQVTLNLLKNVDGICQVNPNDLSDDEEKERVRPIVELSLLEAQQLAAASDDGGEVIQLGALKAAERESAVSLHLRNIATPDKTGTFILRKRLSKSRPFEVIASQERLEAVVINGVDMIGETGYASTATEAFNDQGLSYSLNVETGTRLCYVFRIPGDADKAREQNEKIAEAMRSIEKKMGIKGRRISVSLAENLATVSVVGNGVDSGLSAIIKNVLLYEGIEIKGSSEIKKGGVIPYIIAEEDRQKAVNAIHRYIFSKNNSEYRRQITDHIASLIEATLSRFEAT